MKTLGVVLLLAGLFLVAMLGLGWIATLMMVAGAALLGIGLTGRETVNDAAAVCDGYKYCFKSEGSAIDACPDRKLLRLTDGKKQKEYAFADVRSWDFKLVTGGHFLSGGAAAPGHIIRSNRENRRNNGLFVNVRDTDKPVWRINMVAAQDQERWKELLRQTVTIARRKPGKRLGQSQDAPSRIDLPEPNFATGGRSWIVNPSMRIGSCTGPRRGRPVSELDPDTARPDADGVDRSRAAPSRISHLKRV